MSNFLAVTTIGVGTFFAGAMTVWLPTRPVRTELARARWDAEHDALSGLVNRAGLQRRFEQDRAAGRARIAVLLDLNGFKQINDTWGHHVGDALLVAVARRLTEACAPEAIAGRLGGDEFLVLLPQGDPGDVTQTVQAMLECTAAPITIVVDGDGGTTQLSVTASAGIAGSEADESWSEQLGRADTAMYRAKSRRSPSISAWVFAA
jgi:diguanylate cyclase (GGDEF)-like protein